MSMVAEKIQRVFFEMDTKVQINQLKKISSLLQFQYSMWNYESPEHIKIDYSILVKQCIEFIRAFVSYFENDAFPIDNNLKLFLSNIENFFNIKPFDKRLLKILAYYMEIILDPSIDFWTCYELVLSLERIISKLDREVRVEYFNRKCINVYKLMDILCTCGDYSFQQRILKLIFELIPDGKCNTKLAYYFFPDDKLLQEQMLHISDSCSESDIRTFLNAVNSKNTSVISIRAKVVYGDKVKILPPDFNENDKEIWVDFNIKSESVSIQCALEGLSSNLPHNNMIYDTMFIHNTNIDNINIRRTMKQQVISINLANRISTSSQYSKEFTETCRTVKIVLQKSLYQQELVNTYLPKIFGRLILGDINTSGEMDTLGNIRKPLKVDVKSISCSSHNSNESDSLTEIDNSKKTKTIEYKSLIAGRKSTTASSRISMSIKSFALNLKKYVDDGDENSATIIPEDNDENDHGPPNILVTSTTTTREHNIQIIERSTDITKGIKDISIENKENQSRSLVVQYSEDRSNLLMKDIEDVLHMSILPSQKPPELTALEAKSQAVLNCSRNIVNKHIASDQIWTQNNVEVDSMNTLNKSLEHLDTVVNVSKEKSLAKVNWPTKQYTKLSATLCTLGSISEDDEYFDVEEEPAIKNAVLAEDSSSSTVASTSKHLLVRKKNDTNKPTTSIQTPAKMLDLIRNTNKSNHRKQEDNSVKFEKSKKKIDVFDSLNLDEGTSGSLKLDDTNAIKIPKTKSSQQFESTEESFQLNNERNVKIKSNEVLENDKSIEMSDHETNKNHSCDKMEKRIAFEGSSLVSKALKQSKKPLKNAHTNKLKETKPKKTENKLKNMEIVLRDRTGFSKAHQQSRAKNRTTKTFVTEINKTEILNSSAEQEIKNNCCQNLSRMKTPKYFGSISNCSHNDINLRDMLELLQEMEERERINCMTELSTSEVESSPIRGKKKFSRIIEDGCDENSEPIVKMDKVEGEINEEIITIRKTIDSEVDNNSKCSEYGQSDRNGIESNLSRKSDYSKIKVVEAEIEIEQQHRSNNTKDGHSDIGKSIDEIRDLKEVQLSEIKTMKDLKSKYQKESTFSEHRNRNFEEKHLDNMIKMGITEDQNDNEREMTKENVPINIHKKQLKRIKIRNINNKKKYPIDISNELSISTSNIQKSGKNAKKLEIFGEEPDSKNKKTLVVKLVNIWDQISEMKKIKTKVPLPGNIMDCEEQKISKILPKKVKSNVFQDIKNITDDGLGNSDIVYVSEEFKKKKVNSPQVTKKIIRRRKIKKDDKRLQDVTNIKEAHMSNKNVNISELEKKKHFESLPKAEKIFRHESDPKLEALDNEVISNKITEIPQKLVVLEEKNNKEITKNEDLVNGAIANEAIFTEMSEKDSTRSEDDSRRRCKRTKTNVLIAGFISDTMLDKEIKSKIDERKGNKRYDVIKGSRPNRHASIGLSTISKQDVKSVRKNRVSENIEGDLCSTTSLSKLLNTPLESGKSTHNIKQREDKGEYGENVLSKATEKSVADEDTIQKIMGSERIESLHKTMKTTCRALYPKLEEHDKDKINQITEVPEQLVMFGENEDDMRCQLNASLISEPTRQEEINPKIDESKGNKRNNVNVKGRKPKKNSSNDLNTTSKEDVEVVSKDRVPNNSEDYIDSTTNVFKLLSTQLLESRKSTCSTKTRVDKGENDEDAFRNATKVMKNFAFKKSHTDAQERRESIIVEGSQKQLSKRKSDLVLKDKSIKNIFGSDDNQENQIKEPFDTQIGQKLSNEKSFFKTGDKNIPPEPKITPVNFSIVEGENTTKKVVTSKTHHLTLQYMDYLKSLRKEGDEQLLASQSEINVSRGKSSKRKLYNPTDLSYLDQTKPYKTKQSPIKENIINYNKFVEDMKILNNTENKKRTFINSRESSIKFNISKKKRMDPYDLNCNAEKTISSSSARAGEVFKEIFMKLEKSKRGSKRSLLALPKRISNKSSRVSKNIKRLDKPIGSKFKSLQNVRFAEDVDSSSDVIKQINAFREKLLSVFEEGMQMVHDVTSKLKAAV